MDLLLVTEEYMSAEEDFVGQEHKQSSKIQCPIYEPTLSEACIGSANKFMVCPTCLTWIWTAHKKCQCRLQGAKEDLEAAGLGGILLGGNYVAGVALGKCVEYGYEYANEISKYLSTQEPAATNTEGDAFFV